MSSLVGDQYGSNSWLNVRVRKGDAYGKVVRDHNWDKRTLTVVMDDDTEAQIVMDNFKSDPPETAEWEWYDEPRDKWYRF